MSERRMSKWWRGKGGRRVRENWIVEGINTGVCRVMYLALPSCMPLPQ